MTRHLDAIARHFASLDGGCTSAAHRLAWQRRQHGAAARGTRPPGRGHPPWFYAAFLLAALAQTAERGSQPPLGEEAPEHEARALAAMHF